MQNTWEDEEAIWGNGGRCCPYFALGLWVRVEM